MHSLVFACDSFKGTISSERAAELLEAAARSTLTDVACRSLAVADGGEGTVAAVTSATGGELVSVEVTGPLGAPVTATYGMLPGRRAVIEMAAASGITLVPRDALDPLAASTYGTGQLVLDALDRGATDVSLAIGGSATNDGGMGFARALGARFLDADGAELAGCGADLALVRSIDLSGLDGRLAGVSFHVMCDVDNPLVGPRGATYVFGPQKGADAAALERLEEGMRSYASVLEGCFGVAVADEPGMGAAGGLGAAARLFAGAEVVPGVEWVLDAVGLDEALAGADLCVTGEGHADAQSAHGKVVSGVAARCRAAGVPCVAVVGGMDADATELLGCGVDALVPTVIDAAPLADVLAHAERNFSLAAQRLFSLVGIGARMGGRS
ncbi:glycerate kinase family protein [Thermophilibacter sp.]